jgi:putative acetyltransferase
VHHLREARDDDQDGLIALIGGVFAEYPGCVLDLGEMPELCRIASYFHEHAGRGWVAQNEAGEVVGCIGFSPSVEPNGIELKKLYVRSTERRTGLGARLVELVEIEAKRRNAQFIDLWSDTRFTTAHAFYERRGWIKGPSTRELFDKSNTVEFYFKRAL